MADHLFKLCRTISHIFFYMHCQVKHNLAGFGLRNKFVIDKYSGKVSYNKHHKGMNRHLISHNDRI